MKLGKFETNNIYLGDSYELIKEIPDKSIDLIITDPPYQIDGIHESGCLCTHGIKKGKKAYWKELNENDLDKGINLEILDQYVRVMKKINIYLWCNKEQIIDYLDFFVKKHKCNWEMLIWAKENPTPFCGTHYLKDKEYCLYFWEHGAKLYVPYEKGKTVYFSKTNIDDKNNFYHPTIKPLDLIKNLILNSSGGGQ